MSAGDYKPLPTAPAGAASFPIVFLATAPVSPYLGMAWMDTTTGTLNAWNGTAWKKVSGAGSLPKGTDEGQLLQTGPAPFDWQANDTIDSGRY